jgi:solute carrier family 25 oxoglutarate transporter 11
MVGGFAGSTLVTPTDLALVRMQADSTLPKHQMRNYRNLLDALVRIVREEGILKLWTGY